MVGDAKLIKGGVIRNQNKKFATARDLLNVLHNKHMRWWTIEYRDWAEHGNLMAIICSGGTGN